MMATRSPYGLGALAMLLTGRDLRILEDLERFRLLDTRLVQRLQFPSGPGGQHVSKSSATRTAVRVLTRLEGHGFIARVGRRVGGAGHGSSQTVWQLAASGERLLRARRGQDGRRRYVDPSTTFLAHTLDVARYAATLYETARTTGFEVLELQAEPESWRPFQAAHGGAITLKPDLYLVTADAESETHSFIEIDRDTEHLPAVLRKCRLYQQYRQSGAEQAARDLFPIVVWVTPDEGRARRIRAAIDGDQTLDPELFITATADGSLPVVAPYSSTQPKGGIS
ncbi:hypothetical protein AS96_12890 [Microbacterium sp. MRS-1]|jgi:hypothetical protein|uniref:Replication-relaxation n=1 Tax=Candidatus Microsaccharimonas sossegonensis TaxID=2506948 RepID=A0A4Q0AH56_9BACT|nr:hypothetical protein AS96_12890 [Microbacterium sp. MRS-1]RWZ78502.1 MAG: hypothetical protein EOT05_01990 [Candidatus Microsaccharimonas sossegonensis]